MRLLPRDGAVPFERDRQIDAARVDPTTAQLIEEIYADVPVKRQMSERETFYANGEAKTMLGVNPQHDGWDQIKG